MKIGKNIKKIDSDVLFELCQGYDEEEGLYPESPYEGAAIYRFFRKKYAEETEKKSAFVTYIEENASATSLREMFYNYFIAHLGVLSEEDTVCEEEIERGIYTYFNIKRKRER